MTKYYEPEDTPEIPLPPAKVAKAAPKKPTKPLPSPKKTKACVASRPNETGEDPSEYPTALDTERLKSWRSKYKVPRGSHDKVPGLLLWGFYRIDSRAYGFQSA